MRVLLFTQHYAPEVTAGRFRVEAFVEALVRRGHDVDVVCPVPNHPAGVVEEGFRGRLRVRSEVGGARATYVWVATSPRKTPRTRLAYYGSYAALATGGGMLQARPDLVVASSPPLSVAAVGALVSIRHRVPLSVGDREADGLETVPTRHRQTGRRVEASGEQHHRLLHDGGSGAAWSRRH